MTRRTRAERWIAASTRRGPWGARAGKRLLAAASEGDAEARDGVVRVAKTPDHRLSERAKKSVASWWARTRDPALRQAVLDTGAVAAERPARLQTLGLLDRLGEWRDFEARWAPALLADTDPDVRDRAVAACRNATGSMLAALWQTDADPGTPLRGVLLENDTPPPDSVLDALWDEWLETPAEELGASLLRWRRQAGDPRLAPSSVIALETDTRVLRRPPYRAALLDALLLHGHPLRDIAAEKVLRDRNLIEELCDRALTRPDLAELCVEHRLAPEDPVRRVVFFLLTDQPRQHRALDPDGSLLSLAYTSVSDSVRARIRDAMLTAGDLDLVRVIVGGDRRERIRTMPHDEVRYLAEQLAARRAWEDLWSIVQDVPLATGAGLFHLFDGWEPHHEEERRLFTMFREAGPAALTRGLVSEESWKWSAVTGTRLRFRHHVAGVSFAPDGPFLAVAGRDRVAGVFDLRTARLVERYDWFNSTVGSVLHVGNGIVIAGERADQGAQTCRIVRCVNGTDQTLHTALGSITSLALTGDDGSFAAGTRAGELLLGTPGGPVRVRPVSRFELGRRQWPRLVTAHRGSGRLAVLGRSVHLIDPVAGTAVSAHPGRQVVHAEFVDADTVVCADAKGWTTLLRVADGQSVPARHAQIQGCAGLGVLPHLGQPVIADRFGDLHFLDGSSLKPVDVHRSPAGDRPTGLTVSPTGEFLATGYGDGRINLFDLRLREVSGIAGRPVADLVPRHMGPIGAALASPAVKGQDRSFLELLQALLEHRFRFDVEIGDAVHLAAGEYDISL